LSKVSSLIKCKIHATVPSETIIALCIVFTLESETNHKHISHATTRPIRLVNYQLHIEPVDWEDVWYKDEGGRDKGMTVRVELRHADGSLAIGQRQVPLRFTLVYADVSYTHVHNQNILYIFGDPQQLHINPESGEAMIRFRIQDVSKNHQGQDFKVQFSVDPSLFTDVAPAYSPAVSVRSKNRSKKRLKEGTSDAHLPQKPPKAARKKESISTQESSVATMEQLSPKSIPPPDTVTPIPLNRTPSPTSYAVRSAAAAAVSKALFPMKQSSQISEKVPLPLIEGSFSKAIFPTEEYSQMPQRNALPLTESSFNRIKQPIQNLTAWVEEVVSGLFPLQWTVVGYATHSDGTVDYSRPYHSMTNPNSFIENILSRYSFIRSKYFFFSCVVEGFNMHVAPPFLCAFILCHHFVRYSCSIKEDLHYLSAAVDVELAQGGALKTHSSGCRAVQECHRAASSSSCNTSFAFHSLPGKNTKATRSTANIETPSSYSSLICLEIESQVAYVLAIPYKTLRSRQSCGYPCFSNEKQLIGFFQRIVSPLNSLGTENFVPISLFGIEIFDMLEKEHANNMLSVAILSNSEFLLPVKEIESVSSALEGCALLEWSKECTTRKPSAKPNWFSEF